jgi:uncharacterized protein with von Willebrand factor type A (vWA) domain
MPHCSSTGGTEQTQHRKAEASDERTRQARPYSFGSAVYWPWWCRR